MSKTVMRISNAAEENGLILQLKVEFDVSLSSPKFSVYERELKAGIMSCQDLIKQDAREFVLAFSADDLTTLERKVQVHTALWVKRQEQEKERLADIDKQLAALGFKAKPSD